MRSSSPLFEYLILELYRLGELSSGKAAEYLDMERFEFVKFASCLGIPFIDMDKEELIDDLDRARDAGKRAKKRGSSGLSVLV